MTSVNEAAGTAALPGGIPTSPGGYGSAGAAPELVHLGEGVWERVLELVPAGQITLGAGRREALAEARKHGRGEDEAEEAEVERVQRRRQTRDREPMLLDVHGQIAEAALGVEVTEAGQGGHRMIG